MRLFNQYTLIGCLLWTMTFLSAQTPNTSVMLQGFNWVSSSNTNGWYNVVASKSTELQTAGFNAVWLPPSSNSAASQGYLPRELYNVSTPYGTQAQLTSCITTLHNSGMKVLADIVINHRVGNTGWGDFQNPAWGCWSITNNDEWAQNGGNPCGAGDTGEGYAAARDLDHTNATVRADLKTWMNWMKNTLGFDGWRYDFVKGYSPAYVKEYNDATAPWFSVGEYWDGNRQLIQNWIDGTQQSSTAFDFATKGILQNAVNGNLGMLSNGGQAPGLIGWSPTKSVTFIDNHDTGSSQNLWPFPADKVMQGYAYILTHPGIPMVFWDHYFDWAGLKSQINALIAIRKANGLQAGSTLNIQAASNNLYAAIIDNKVAMKIGSDNWTPSGTGWILKTSGNNYAVWDKLSDCTTLPPTLTANPAAPATFTVASTPVTFTASSCNGAAATIYYTTNGTTPTTASPNASGSLTLNITSTTTVMAFARSAQGQNSAVQTFVYTVNATCPAATVTPSPAAPYTSAAAFNVTLSTTTCNGALATLYYTTNGTTPTTSSPVYTSPILISQTTTLKVLAKNSQGLLSPVQTYVYTIGTVTGFTVYFKKPATWGAPKVYYWNTLPAGAMPAVTWPGVAMTLDATYGACGWYKFTFNGTTSTNLIFTDGTNQTADLSRSSTGWYDSGTWYNSNPQAGGCSFVVDGQLDANVPLVATNGGVKLYAKFNGTQLYVATQSAPALAKDVFIFVSPAPGAMAAAPWSKSGTVAGNYAFLANESTNNYNAWTGLAAGAGASSSGTYLEGTINVAAQYGTIPAQLKIAVGRYGTNNAGTLSGQCPAAVTSNGNIEATEFYTLILSSALTAVIDDEAGTVEAVMLEPSEKTSSTTPQDVTLYQNIPNPFDATTEIPVYLPDVVQVSLCLYDLNGRLVQTVVAGELSAGYHDLSIDATALPRGLYYYMLRAGSKVLSKKMSVE